MDERTSHDVDRRLRAAFPIEDGVSRRVLAQALKTAPAPPLFSRHLKSASALSIAIVVAVSLTVWRRWHAAPAPPAELRITATGAILVVESQDGRRWIVGAPPARPSGGNYVLVVPQ